MIKQIFKLIKKIIFAAFVLYGFNLIMSPLSIIVPINLITVSIVTLLGFSGMFGLVIILLVAL